LQIPINIFYEEIIKKAGLDLHALTKVSFGFGKGVIFQVEKALWLKEKVKKLSALSHNQGFQYLFSI